MLSSESTFLPFTSDPMPPMTNSDSEDETETFEPDSLAPKWPTKPKEPNKNKIHHSPTQDKQTRVVEEVISGTSTASTMLEVRASTPQNHREINSDSFKDTEEAPKRGEEDITKQNLIEANKAAVKIQSWWRGQHTRCCHPVAREVRSEIRLRRMQDHILFLTEKCDRYFTKQEFESLNLKL